MITNQLKIIIPYTITSLEAITEVDEFIVYPNPSNNSIYYPESFIGLPYYIYDAYGNLVLAGTASENELTVDQLTDGFYILIFNSTTGIRRSHFIRM